MRTLSLLLVLTAVVAGCTPLVAPEPTVPTASPQDVAAFFWPDSDAVYIYRSDSDTHTVTVKKGGTITDMESTTNSTATWSVTRNTNGNITLAGLTSSDLFGLDPEVAIVADTTSTSSQQSVPLRSIAASGDKVFVASDTTLYKVEAGQLTPVCHMPAIGLTLEPGPDCLYAVEFGGDKIFSTTDDGGSWPSVTTPARGIRAFVADDGGARRHCWAAVGNVVYEFQNNLQTPASSTPMVDSVLALAPGFAGSVLVGLDKGVFAVSNGATPQLIFGLTGAQHLRALSRHFAGSTAGVFDLQLAGPPVLNGDVSTLYDDDDATYVGMSNGDVYRRDNSFMPRFQPLLPKPSNVSVTQFATYGSHGTHSVFVLAGSTLFHQVGGTWDTIQRTWSTTNPLKPGAFTFLSPNAAAWQAALFEQGTGGGSVALSDQAAFVANAKDIVLDGVTYHDILVIRYAAYRGAQGDSPSTPQYLIYYQRNIGPIRIEKTENSQTTITRLVK